MKLSRFLCLSLAALLAFNSVFAQNSQTAAEKEKARREQEKQEEIEKKSVVMLGEIAAAADTLKIPVNRISIFSSVGVQLWKYDEKQARNIVNTAAQEIVNLQNTEDEEQQSDNYQFAWQIQEARRQLVQTLAVHDAEFALQIYRQTRSAEVAALMQSPKNIFPNGNDYSRVQNELATEQQLINEIARQDPKRAVKLARELLEKGVSYALLDLIDRIREKDPEEASRLADDILRKFQDIDFSVNHNERNLAVNIISRFMQPDENTGGEKSKFVVNESSLRSLADKVAVFFLRDVQAENYSYQFAALIAIMDKFSPSRASQLRQKENEIKQKQERTNPYERLNRINENSDAETLISEAQNAPSELKSQYYTYAANKLMSSDNTERARALINLIPDKRARDYALQNLITNLFYKAINAGNVDEARRIAAQMANKTQQVYLYIQIFNLARQKQDDKLARQILDEASSFVKTNPENNNEMSALFQLASAYASIAPENSLAMIEPTIVKTNELLNASILLNRFSGNESNRADEITMLFFQSTLSQYGFYYNQSDFAKLAAANFERTKSLADGFQRPEARIFMRLIIVQAILSQISNNKTFISNNFTISRRSIVQLSR